MKYSFHVALAAFVLASAASAQVAAPRRPVVAPQPATTPMVPPAIRSGSLGNQASRLQPAPFLSQSEFNTLIGVVGTPNDFATPTFNTSFVVKPLDPVAEGKGKLATVDLLAEPDYVSEIVGGGAIINYGQRAAVLDFTPFDSTRRGGAEITINALRGEVYAVNCLADVNGNPNALVYYRTSNPTGSGAMISEQGVQLKNYHFVALVKRANQNGQITLLLRPEAYILPGGASSSNSQLGSLSKTLSGARRASMTPEERAAEDAAAAAAAAAPPPPPVRHTMKLWGCQVSSAN